MRRAQHSSHISHNQSYHSINNFKPCPVLRRRLAVCSHQTLLSVTLANIIIFLQKDGRCFRVWNSLNWHIHTTDMSCESQWSVNMYTGAFVFKTSIHHTNWKLTRWNDIIYSCWYGAFHLTETYTQTYTHALTEMCHCVHARTHAWSTELFLPREPQYTGSVCQSDKPTTLKHLSPYALYV